MGRRFPQNDQGLNDALPSELAGRHLGTGQQQGWKSNEVVVFDESAAGANKGVNTGAKRDRTDMRTFRQQMHYVKKRRPARTARTQSAMKARKRPAAPKRLAASSCTHKKVAGTDKDRRKNGRWLFLAIPVGKGTERHSDTHENGKKRLAWEILPRRADAPKGKPRGFDSMKATVAECITKKPFLVFDGLTSVASAVQSLGYKHAPPVKHDEGWRDRQTGFHSNGCESGNSRFKTWLRSSYTRLRLKFAKVPKRLGRQQ